MRSTRNNTSENEQYSKFLQICENAPSSTKLLLTPIDGPTYGYKRFINNINLKRNEAIGLLLDVGIIKYKGSDIIPNKAVTEYLSITYKDIIISSHQHIYKDRKGKKHRVRLQFISISSGFDDNSRKYHQVSETDLRTYLRQAVGHYNSTVHPDTLDNNEHTNLKATSPLETAVHSSDEDLCKVDEDDDHTSVGKGNNIAASLQSNLTIPPAAGDKIAEKNKHSEMSEVVYPSTTVDPDTHHNDENNNFVADGLREIMLNTEKIKRETNKINKQLDKKRLPVSQSFDNNNIKTLGGFVARFLTGPGVWRYY